MVLDESDRSFAPLGYNKGVEGIISVESGSDLTLCCHVRSTLMLILQ